MRGDSYVLESNIHFPTDLNLLYDSCRKVLDFLDHLGSPRTRHYQLKSFRQKLRSYYYHSSEIHRKKGKDYVQRLEASVKIYLQKAKNLATKAQRSIDVLSSELKLGTLSIKECGLLVKLAYYFSHLEKFIDLTSRRILKGESIPHEEKIFSIFEPHAEWISKGKLGKGVEFGHPHLVYSDQYQFILHHQVLVGQSDKQVALEQALKIKEIYGTRDYHYASISYDKGFYSSLTKKELSKHFDKVMMQKVGKKTPAQKAEESREDFVALRHHHSGIEGVIHKVEMTGLDKCPDKGLQRFKNYAAAGVLAYNVNNLGKIIREIEKKQADQQSYKRAA